MAQALAAPIARDPFAERAKQGKRKGQHNGSRLEEGQHIHLGAHEDEEERREHHHQGMDQVIEAVQFPFLQGLHVGGLQDQPRCVGADDAREAREVAQVGQEESKAEAQGKENLFAAEAIGEAEQMRRGMAPQGQGHGQETQGQGQGAQEAAQWRTATVVGLDEAGDQHQHEQAQDVVHHRRADDDAAFR